MKLSMKIFIVSSALSFLLSSIGMVLFVSSASGLGFSNKAFSGDSEKQDVAVEQGSETEQSEPEDEVSESHKTNFRQMLKNE